MKCTKIYNLKKLLFYFIGFMVGFAAFGQTPERINRKQAYDNWRSMRVGLFVHWGPSAGLGTPESHSHARKSALNPHGNIPANMTNFIKKLIQ